MAHTLAALAVIVVSNPAFAQQTPGCPPGSAAWQLPICDSTLLASGAPQSLPPVPPMPPVPPQVAMGTVWIHITNVYDSTLGALGIAGVRRRGTDRARNELTWDGTTYTGVLRADTNGRFHARTLLGGCSDYVTGEQEIYAVGHPEFATTTFLPTDSLISGVYGTEDLILYFFPETPPVMTPVPRCQEAIRFEGYGLGPNDNQAPYPWLPQTRAPAYFLPFNDTRWTTQNGLRVHLPPAGEEVTYWDKSQVLPGQGVNSRWLIAVVRGN
jgi:hypothetical protein